MKVALPGKLGAAAFESAQVSIPSRLGSSGRASEGERC